MRQAVGNDSRLKRNYRPSYHKRRRDVVTKCGLYHALSNESSDSVETRMSDAPEHAAI